MIIRHQDVEYKSFTRNRLTMFEYRRKPLLDQLERIENDIKKLRPETDNKRLRGSAAIPAADKNKTPPLSRNETYNEKRCRELEAKQLEVKAKLEALDIEEEDIELQALVDEINYLDKKKTEYLESLERAKKKFEADWNLTGIELKYSEQDYIHKLLSRLESLGQRQKEINDLKALRDRKKRPGVTGGRMVSNAEDQENHVTRSETNPSTDKEQTGPLKEDQKTTVRRRAGRE